MKTYRLYQVDSFTKERFKGNPAGVVPNAEGLTEEEMLKIAREMNNSETAFIFEGGGNGYDVQVRFFTPLREVPICGHATIASHYVRALEKKILQSETIVQKTGAGLLPIDILCEGNDYKIVMTQGEFSLKELPEPEIKNRILHALGMKKEDWRSDCPMVIASTGHGKVMVGIKDLKTLNRLAPDMEALKQLSLEIDCSGYYVFTLTPEEKILVHGRMFGPAVGVMEDPVTGNANGPLGGYLVHFGLIDIREPEVRFMIAQGEAMGRRGTMEVIVGIRDGKVEQIRIAGNAVIVFKTELDV